MKHISPECHGRIRRTWISPRCQPWRMPFPSILAPLPTRSGQTYRREIPSHSQFQNQGGADFIQVPTCSIIVTRHWRGVMSKCDTTAICRRAGQQEILHLMFLCKVSLLLAVVYEPWKLINLWRTLAPLREASTKFQQTLRVATHLYHSKFGLDIFTGMPKIDTIPLSSARESMIGERSARAHYPPFRQVLRLSLRCG